jgi:hypothetical protein
MVILATRAEHSNIAAMGVVHPATAGYRGGFRLIGVEPGRAAGRAVRPAGAGQKV